MLIILFFMKRTHFELIVCLLVVFCACGEVPENHLKGFNPIIPDFVADPSVACFNDTFYLYGTTDINQGLNKMGKPVVWESRDFVHWSFEGSILEQIDWDRAYIFKDEEGNIKTGYYRYWAPGKLLEKDGKYYLFPSIVSPDDKMGIYVLVANHPKGPFSFINGEGLYFNEPENAAKQAKALVQDIDGEVFVDSDGQAYLYWRRRHAAKISSDFSRLEDEPIVIPTYFSGYSEGPVLFKRNDLYYYIYTLLGHANYCNAYMISKTSPLGPFEVPKVPNIFIHSSINNQVWGPGHGNVFQVPNSDDFYFVYLEYGHGGSTRRVFVNKMEFNPDGTIKNLIPDRMGVGLLGRLSENKPNLAIAARVNASSRHEAREVKTEVIPDPNRLSSLDIRSLEGEMVARTYDYKAANACDGSNASCWMADTTDSRPFIRFDLGRIRNISVCQMFFIYPTYGHNWILEKSFNGRDWEQAACETDKAIRSPHYAGEIGKARYLRLTITDGPAGLWEMKIF